MSHSPAKAHFLRTSAASMAVDSGAATRPDATQYELMLLKLHQDKHRLKGVQSIERKIEVKRELLPAYAPWIEGVLAGDSGVQDEVFMTVLVWKIDVGDLDGAFTMAAYAIKHKLAMPDQYNRNVATVVAEQFADGALKDIAAGKQADLQALQAAFELTEGEDMPDQVRAKLCKAIGYGYRAAAGDEKKPGFDRASAGVAMQYLQRALVLFDKIGVKKDIERLETAIKNSAPPPDTGAPG